MKANVQTRVSEKVSAGLLRMSQWAEASVHKRTLGARAPYEQQVIGDLSAEGVHVTSVARLFPGSEASLLDSLKRAADYIAAERLAANSSSVRKRDGSTDLLSNELLRLFPELFLMGLDPTIIRIAEHYFGLPVAYHGAALRRSLTDGQQSGPRLWHMDSEDFHVLRVVVYLNDVTPGAVRSNTFRAAPECPTRRSRVLGPSPTSGCAQSSTSSCGSDATARPVP